MFGLKTEEVTEGWTKLHNEELHNLYSSSNIKDIKLRTMKWKGVKHVWKKHETPTRFWQENLNRRNLSENQGMD
jgi:hypothetical protein